MMIKEDRLKILYLNKINGQECVLWEDLLPLLKYNIYMLLTDDYVGEAQHKMLSMVSGMYNCKDMETLKKENVDNYKNIMENTTYQQRKDFFLYYIKVLTYHVDLNIKIYTKRDLELILLPRLYNMRAWFKECSGTTCDGFDRVDEGVNDIVEDYVNKVNTILKEEGLDTRLTKREVLYELSSFR